VNGFYCVKATTVPGFDLTGKVGLLAGERPEFKICSALEQQKRRVCKYVLASIASQKDIAGHALEALRSSKV
jgi:hypothetical protein